MERKTSLVGLTHFQVTRETNLETKAGVEVSEFLLGWLGLQISKTILLCVWLSPSLKDLGKRKPQVCT